MKILILLFLLGACASGPQKMNKLELGMTPYEVKEILGEPYSTSGKAPYLLYKYRLKEKDDIPIVAHVFTFGMLVGAGKKVSYIVRFKKGKVDFFGRPIELPEPEKKKVEKSSNPVNNTINIGNVNKN